jgi:hypothetical protein
MLQRYRFELCAGRRLDRFLSITMAPKQGMPLYLRTPGQGYAASPRLSRGNVRSMLEM